MVVINPQAIMAVLAVFGGREEVFEQKGKGEDGAVDAFVYIVLYIVSGCVEGKEGQIVRGGMAFTLW